MQPGRCEFPLQLRSVTQTQVRTKCLGFPTKPFRVLKRGSGQSSERAAWLRVAPCRDNWGSARSCSDALAACWEPEQELEEPTGLHEGFTGRNTSCLVPLALLAHQSLLRLLVNKSLFGQAQRTSAQCVLQAGQSPQRVSVEIQGFCLFSWL